MQLHGRANRIVAAHLNMIEAAKAPIRAKGVHPFRVIKNHGGFQKTWLQGMVKNRCKVNVLATLTNPFLPLHRLLTTTCT
jgi:IS5 family transposase